MRGPVVTIIAESGLLDTFRATRIERLAASLARVCRVDVLFTERRGVTHGPVRGVRGPSRPPGSAPTQRH